MIKKSDITSKLNRKIRISVIIITCERTLDLLQCLGSVLTQTIPPFEIIVIDNGPSIKTQKEVVSLQKNLRRKIKYIQEKRRGQPFARNTGLKKSSGDWILFIDDDCVANPFWYQSFVTFLRLNKLKNKPASVIGESPTYFTKNTYSLATHFIQEYWKINRIRKNKVLDMEILDTKNLLLPRKFLIQNKIFFRPFFYKGVFVSEDCDLGMQLHEKGVSAFFLPNATVLHKDSVDFTSFWKRLFIYTIGHSKYETEWQYKRKQIKPIVHLNIFSFFNSFSIKYNLNLISKIKLAALILLAVVFFRSIKFFYTFKFI